MHPIFKQETNWNGTLYIEEFYLAENFANLQPITQVQAVTFLDKNHIVLYEHIEGHFGLPGGKVEPDENLEQALRRECIEEMQAKILHVKPIGYFKTYKKSEPDKISYNARYVAVVQLLDAYIKDPSKKSIGRKIVKTNEAAKILNWGEKAEVLVNTAIKQFSHL